MSTLRCSALVTSFVLFASPSAPLALAALPAQDHAKVPTLDALSRVEVEPAERAVIGTWEGSGSLTPRLKDPRRPGSWISGPNSGVLIAFSPDGRHFARVGMKGSRAVVELDGVPGPTFDEIVVGHGLTFHGADGPLTYVGRRGDVLHVVHGGEEGPAVSHLLTEPIVGASGKRVAYAAELVKGAERRPGIVVDGKFVETVRPVRELALSPLDGSLAYVLSAAYQVAPTVVVEGGADRPYAHSFGFTTDGRLTFVEAVEGRLRLVVGEEESGLFDEITGVVFTPDGAHHAFFAKRATPEHDAKRGTGGWKNVREGFVQLVVHGDAEHAYGKSLNSRFQHRLLLSADGALCAYTSAATLGGAVGIHGELGSEYASVHDLCMDAGGRVSYLAQQGKFMFPVVDGVEKEGIEGQLAGSVTSPDGRRVASQVRGPRAIQVVVSGKPQEKFTSIGSGSLVFSPDSRHLAYVAQRMDGEVGTFLVVDGAVTRRLSEGTTGNDLVAPRFTADGEHVHYRQRVREEVVQNGRPRSAFREYLVVDGQRRLVADNQLPGELFLSADGRHWATWIIQRRNPVFRLVIDGREVAAEWTTFLYPFMGTLAANPGAEISALASAFGDDGTFVFLALTEGRVERVVYRLADLNAAGG